MKKKSNILLGISILCLLLGLFSLMIIFSTTQTALFPERQDAGNVLPVKTTYMEGEELTLKIDNEACNSIWGKAIWIDGKKYGCDESYHCIGHDSKETSSFVCSTKNVYECGGSGNIFQNTPSWGFNYGNAELEKGLIAGSHIVEGWVVYSISQFPCYNGGKYGSQGGSFFRFEINVKPFPCTFDQNQMLVVESFSDDFSESSLRFTPAKYCSIHPPIVIDRFTMTSYNDLTVYEKLKNKQTVPVDENKVISIFYVIDRTSEIPVVCDPTKAYNIKEERCEDVIGFIQVCSQGYFDPAKGICTIQPEFEYLCPNIDGKPARYDSAQGVCIVPFVVKCDIGEYKEGIGCVYTPDKVGVCPEGSWDKDRNACVIIPDLNYLCLTGKMVDAFDEETNSTKKVCQISPEEKIICRTGFEYDKESDKCVKKPKEPDEGFNKLWFIPIGLGSLSIISLIIYFIKRKKR